ncbi:MAM domain-containing glycosylphosphatidylinositol anchor protein 2-like [Branchiostoma lanceolatum]|uniref:MAM domain-containing glycosylphosphatidylinositol anchor protein 2-like n=1 Tax=Branchiostoma lanceolatum TaxID=7740 RepID=UPI0034516581
MFDCNFEADLCGWTQNTSDTFNWTRHLGATSSYYTGPSFDHTMGNETGYYIFIEASTPQVEGDIARLYSPTVTANSTMCVRFWYHMYGMHMGTLNVYAQTGSTLPEVPIFNRIGRQGDQWIQAEVEINISSTYQVVMEGIRGPGFRGDIGLDDISIATGSCAKGTFALD